VVKGQAAYDKKDVENNAKVIRTMSELPWDAAMYPGSDRGDTTLKATAMKEKDKFMGTAKQFESAARKLVDTAEKGDLAAVKAQFGAVAGSCKDCHGTFRKK